MSKKSIKNITLDKFIQKASSLLQSKEGIIVAYLHGSYLLRPNSEHNDIDIGVVLNKKTPFITMEKEIELSSHLEEMLGISPIDVKVLNSAPKFFQYKVIRDGKVIFCCSELKRIEYEVNLTNEYFDVKPMLDYYNSCMYQNIKEGMHGPGSR